MKYKISVIGYGNLGFHLVKHLQNAGHKIVQIYSRKKTESGFIHDLSEVNSDADVYFLSVKDDVVKDVAKHISVKGKIIAHCSASVEKEVLSGCSENFGVFYPLQSFSKNTETSFKNIPILVEGVNEKTTSVLKEIAFSLSEKVIEVSAQQRLAVHVAAVFANNFSNHLFSVAEEILKKENISFDVLIPLIEETIRKVKTHSPAETQTGPAIRGDEQTIQKHLAYLSENKELQKLYSLLTERIKNNSNN